MSYWGDKRDTLENLYPTSTSFCKFHESYPESLIEGIECGIIFLMAFWSGPSVQRFKSACYSLEDAVMWERFSFHVVDVDSLNDSDLFTSSERLGGYGETFWIKDGLLVGSMGEAYSVVRFDELTRLITD